MITIGIQGGKGSYNEEALLYLLRVHQIRNFKIRYLFTTEGVLFELENGDIDFGQFAIENAAGGLVRESFVALTKYRCKPLEVFQFKISHCLLIHRDATLQDINTIMTHPQVLKQCKETLKQKYTNIEKKSGEGDLIDHGKVAEMISKDVLPKSTAVMGSRTLSRLYKNLKIVDENLQDLEENYTTFVFCEKRKSSTQGTNR